MKKNLQGKELEIKATSLGVDIYGEGKTHSVSGSRSSSCAPDHILHQRIFEFERAKRESKLFWIATLAAIFSVVGVLLQLLVVVVTN